MKEIIRKIVIAVLIIAVVGAVASFALRSDEPEVPEQSTSEDGFSSTEGKLNPDNSVNATTGSQGSSDTQNQQTTTNANAPSQQGTQPSQQTQNPAGPQDTTGSQGSSDPQNQQNTTTNSYAPSQQGTQPSQQTQNPAGPQDTTGSQGSSDAQNQQTTTNANAPSQQGTQPSQGQPNTGDSQVAPQDPVNPQPPQPVNKIYNYQQIFKSGRFLMKVNDPDLGDVTMAMSGNKMLVEASMEGITLKMLYDGDKPDEDNPASGTWYIVIDKIKKYSPMPADMLGNMNVEELTKDFAKGDSNTVYTKSVETVNGEQLDCESCVDVNGNTTKYYFRGDQLVRSDSISPSGEVSTTEFREINGNVDESMFVIPSGYAKWDISWLLNMAV